jgi:hypothetical protein
MIECDPIQKAGGCSCRVVLNFPFNGGKKIQVAQDFEMPLAWPSRFSVIIRG